MSWLAWAGFGFVVVRAVVSVINFLTWPVLRPPQRYTAAAVSVLIPARNEGQRIGPLLQALHQAKAECHEVLVLDDGSTDNTAAVVKEFMPLLPQLQLLQGKPLPQGWLGKNWACHQLAEKATGDYLLFLDADVVPDPAFVPAVVNAMQRNQAALVSVFPRQQMMTPGEQITVPVMFEILLGLLPLKLVSGTSVPALSAANGQCMLFDGGVYRHEQWHRRVCDHQVEDIAISRRVKRQGYAMAVWLSPHIRCRMYGGFREAVDGFAKNIRVMLGGNGLMVLYCSLLVAAPIAALFHLRAATLATWLLLEMFVVVLHCRLAGMPVVPQLAYLPLRRIALVWTAAVALLKHYFGSHLWKGRRLG